MKRVLDNGHVWVMSERASLPRRAVAQATRDHEKHPLPLVLYSWRAQVRARIASYCETSTADRSAAIY